MYQSHKHERAVTIAPQETPTPALDSSEMTEAELIHVAGGTEGAPGGINDHNGRSGV